ncbi:MAG: hypothetical protein ACI8V5_002548 [Limisphaerales bacterium]|jgi:hypothetical protein
MPIIEPKTAAEASQLVVNELNQFADPNLAARSKDFLITPRPKILVWEYGQNEEFEGWLIADMRERGVFAAYCCAGGHGSRGFPWGLVFQESSNFGQNCGWYPKLADLFEEWFV